MSRWTEAQTIFLQLIDFSGQVGLFAKQIESRLELATLMRYCGEFNKFESIIDQLKLKLTNIPHEITTEEIELALELGNFDHAENLLSILPNSPRKDILRLSVDVLSGAADDEHLHSLAEKIIMTFPDNSSVKARVHGLLGKRYEQLDNWEHAKAHFVLALELLTEADNDPFGLARSQTNLAALLMSMGNFDEANSLLQSASHIQNVIKDYVGLAATRHNIHLLQNGFGG
ncbi:MAG: tetratricopeptide repeat protein [Anaerolineae bacterium]